MVNLTLSISEDLQSRMKEHSEIRWSEVVRRSILEKVDTLDVMNKLTNKSRLTKRDVDEISKVIDSNVAKKLGLK